MAKERRFTFVCDRNDEETLAVLAQQFRRSRSDVVRLLITEEAERRNIVAPSVGPALPVVRTCQPRQGTSKLVSGDSQDTAFFTEG